MRYQKGNEMLITIEQLEEWAADPYMRKWFVKRFPSGSAEYQAVLDALSEEDEVWWANYLMDSAGSDALVTAKRRPSNLVSGQWCPKEK